MQIYKEKIMLYNLRVFIMALLTFCLSSCSTAQEQKIRPAGVAGGFYPEDPKVLTKMIDGFLEKAEIPSIKGTVYGVVAPHAGYVYSGHVAAYSYALLKKREIERVIVISPSHIEAFRGASIYNGDAYNTPLGNINIDKAFCKSLAEQNELLYLSAKGHETESYGRMEHALEVHLPFLQRAIEGFKLVPIVMGDQSYESCRALGVGLAKLIKNPKTIIVASSDLSHFHNYAEAVKLDKKVLNAIEEWDYFNMSRNLRSRIWEACGGGPIVATMIASEKLGANKAKIIKYANSGDVEIGDKSSVVGYASVVFYEDATTGKKMDSGIKLNKAEQEYLLRIAKESVETVVRKGKVLNCNSGGFSSLSIDRGAFVTLNKEGHLRGCIGYTAPMQPLCQTVCNAAASAAVKDHRFMPVSSEELAELTYDISVLSPFRLVKNIEQIKIGKHGLLIKNGPAEGLLLPQVASDYNWDRITFLQQTCRKAGLPIDAWKSEDTDIFMFSAFVFGEE